jgi:type II secretory pathway pseudopilin PulG
MTLMEVVIAIGVVAFVVPIILAATGSAGSSRRNAEADTRSAWLAREVQQELLVSWGDFPAESVFETAQNFPVLATEAAPTVLLYDASGKFLAKGTNDDFTKASKVPKATYVVAIYAEAYIPPNLTGTANSLATLRIRILHPAKDKPGSRSTYRYNLITSRQGTL